MNKPLITRISIRKWNDEWDAPDTTRSPEIYLCGLPFSVTEMENKYGLDFESYEERGLGTMFSDFICCGDLIFHLKGCLDKNLKDDGWGVTAIIKHTEHAPQVYLDALCEALGIGKLNLVYVVDFAECEERKQDWLKIDRKDCRPRINPKTSKQDLCDLPFSVNHIESKYGLKFLESNECWGTLYSSTIEYANIVFYLESNDFRDNRWVTVRVIKRDEIAADVYLEKICEFFDITNPELQRVWNLD